MGGCPKIVLGRWHCLFDEGGDEKTPSKPSDTSKLANTQHPPHIPPKSRPVEIADAALRRFVDAAQEELCDELLEGRFISGGSGGVVEFEADFQRLLPRVEFDALLVDSVAGQYGDNDERERSETRPVVVQYERLAAWVPAVGW